MPATLASHCRIKQKRRHLRRRTSGRTVFGYVGGNPLSYKDPKGLEGVGFWTVPPGPERDAMIARTYHPDSDAELFGRAANPTSTSNAGVMSWLCKAHASGQNPSDYFMQERNAGLDVGDSNLAAAERYENAYDGSFGSSYAQSAIAIGMDFGAKWARVIPGMDTTWLGRNGSPAIDAAFVNTWGLTGAWDRAWGLPNLDAGGGSGCGCGK